MLSLSEDLDKQGPLAPTQQLLGKLKAERMTISAKIQKILSGAEKLY
jgi:hypothetical protein